MKTFQHYHMFDHAAGMKRRLLGKQPEKRLHWLTYGAVLALFTLILTVPMWAK